MVRQEIEYLLMLCFHDKCGTMNYTNKLHTIHPRMKTGPTAQNSNLQYRLMLDLAVRERRRNIE